MKSTWEVERTSKVLVFPWENEETSEVARNVREARKELARRRTQERHQARRFKVQVRRLVQATS